MNSFQRLQQNLRKLPILRATLWKKDWLFIFGLLLLVRFAYRVIQVSLSFPNLLRVNALLPPEFLQAGLVVLVGLGLTVRWLKSARSKYAVQFASFLRQNARGLLLAAIFFVVYFVLANVFNRLDLNNNNIFFAADTHQWRLRLASIDGYLMEMRAIHPLGFLILRPLVLPSPICWAVTYLLRLSFWSG